MDLSSCFKLHQANKGKHSTKFGWQPSSNLLKIFIPATILVQHMPSFYPLCQKKHVEINLSTLLKPTKNSTCITSQSSLFQEDLEIFLCPLHHPTLHPSYPSSIPSLGTCGTWGIWGWVPAIGSPQWGPALAEGCILKPRKRLIPCRKPWFFLFEAPEMAVFQNGDFHKAKKGPSKQLLKLRKISWYHDMCILVYHNVGLLPKNYAGYAQINSHL